VRSVRVDILRQQHRRARWPCSTRWDTKGVHRFIFSSSATVYGAPDTLPLTGRRADPSANPYGQTKAMVEADPARNWWQRADAAQHRRRLCATSTRSARHESGTIGEDPQDIPKTTCPVHHAGGGRQARTPERVGQTTGRRETARRARLPARDRPSHAGTLLRWSLRGRIRVRPRSNLGTGHGTSVLEMVKAFEHASGSRFRMCSARAATATSPSATRMPRWRGDCSAGRRNCRSSAPCADGCAGSSGIRRLPRVDQRVRSPCLNAQGHKARCGSTTPPEASSVHLLLTRSFPTCVMSLVEHLFKCHVVRAGLHVELAGNDALMRSPPGRERSASTTCGPMWMRTAPKSSGLTGRNLEPDRGSACRAAAGATCRPGRTWVPVEDLEPGPLDVHRATCTRRSVETCSSTTS